MERVISEAYLPALREAFLAIENSTGKLADESIKRLEKLVTEKVKMEEILEAIRQDERAKNRLLNSRVFKRARTIPSDGFDPIEDFGGEPRVEEERPFIQA
jgi:hypothetical protein